MTEREQDQRTQAVPEPVSLSQVWDRYQQGMDFKRKIGLFDTIQRNENFFIGRQWEGVDSGGLPTPVFNFLKRVILFQVASITSDRIKMQASPLPATSSIPRSQLDRAAALLTRQYDQLFQANRLHQLVRELVRNAAVDGDGCLYSYWDETVETGQYARGDIRTEVLQSSRVLFGDPNERRVQRQPYLMIVTRERVEEVRRRAREHGSAGWQRIHPDQDDAGDRRDALTEDKVTVVLQLRRDRDSGHIVGCECTRDTLVRPEWDLGLRHYPLVWLSWDYVQNSYHGQGAVTGLIPNQIFINKLFAMAQISLMTTAFPKVIYDKTRIPRWDNRVGGAIAVSGGDINTVAKIMDPAAISPQVGQFIDTAIEYTKSFMGATDAAMGDTRPDNTSAIVALQRASSIPLELTKQNLYQCLEDLGRIYLDFMTRFYGVRLVQEEAQAIPTQVDFTALRALPLSLQVDVGPSAYWSELASVQTLDNLLAQDKIPLVDYLERIPEGYISGKQELVEKLHRQAQEESMDSTLLSTER